MPALSPPRWARSLWCGLGVCAAFFTGGTACAVAPNFTSIAPAGGQRGAEIAITLRGERLADLQEVFFYRPGITLAKIAEATEKEAKLVFQIAADCPVGEHPLRLRTAGGVSALRIFYVGPFANVEEKEPNNERAQAQTIPLNSTVEGSIGSEDIDFFTVSAQSGQRLSVEIEGARLGRTLFDPFIAIRDANGRILASSDDTPLLGHDSFTSIIVPADGNYSIQVRDMAYNGTGHFYRLHVGDFPRPAVVSPLGGQAGDTLATTFLGDPLGSFTQQITLPPPTLGKFGVLAEQNGPAPSPNWMRTTDFPNAASVLPGKTPAEAPLLNIPAPLAFNGILATKGEAAFFRFTGKKNQNLDFQVFARRLGSPIDSVLTVFDAKAKSLGSNDDAAGNPDSALRLKLPEDGEYTIKVADQLNRGGPLHAFRVEITEVQPSLILSIPDTARYDHETRKSIVVPRGNRFAVLMNINREAFNGDINLAFEGLPTGITAQAATVPGSLSAVPVVFTAAADAPIAGKLLIPTGRAANATPDKPVASRYRHTVDWVRIQNATVYTASEVNQIAAAVTEEVPFQIRITQPQVPLVVNGEMSLQIVAERQPDFDEPITLKMLWNPPGVTSLPDMVIPKGATQIDYKLNSSNKAEVGTWKIAVIAGATVKGGTAYVSSQWAELAVAAAHLTGKMELAKVERGQTTQMICTLEQKIPFEGTAIARLVGLPDTVTAAPVEITQASKEAVFVIATTEKSPTGNHKNVFCQVILSRAGEPISHLIAAGSVLRIDSARPKPVAVLTKPPSLANDPTAITAAASMPTELASKN